MVGAVMEQQPCLELLLPLPLLPALHLLLM
jgi:hypothetical protein